MVAGDLSKALWHICVLERLLIIAVICVHLKLVQMFFVCWAAYLGSELRGMALKYLHFGEYPTLITSFN